MKNISKVGAVAAVSLVLAACAGRRHETRTTYMQTDDGTSASSWVDVDSVSDVSADASSGRTYFYDPADSTHVYWFESTNPEVWSYRPVYRDGNRTYFIERSGNGVRRIWFDESNARVADWTLDSRWDVSRRERLREIARAEWMRRESDERDWRNRWDVQHATTSVTTYTPPRGPTYSPPPTTTAVTTTVTTTSTDRIVDVTPDTYPDRTYFYDPADSTHVYWFDTSDSSAWNYRPVYRSGDRSYFLDRSGTTVRRVWFDERRARNTDLASDSRWTEGDRGRLREAARSAFDSDDESDWQSRLDAKVHEDVR